MAVTAARTIEIVYTGDVTGTQTIADSDNVASPGQLEIKTLAAGANTITVPTGGATTVAVTIEPPPGNTQSLTLKGVTGDTGVRLHNTGPSSIALDSSVTTFVLTTGAQIAGVRFYWS